MKKVPVSLIPALNAGAEKQVVPYEDYWAGVLSSVYKLMLRDSKTFASNFLPAVERFYSLPYSVRKSFPSCFLDDLFLILDEAHPDFECWCSGHPFTLCGNDDNVRYLRCDSDCNHKDDDGNDKYFEMYGVPFSLVHWITYGGEML